MVQRLPFFFFRGGVAVADSPVAVAVVAASVERITAVAGAVVVSLYAAPMEGTAVADAAAIALAASAPVVVDAAVVDDTVCVDFFLRSHSSRFCLRLWFAGRCLPCFLGALAAVEV